MLSHERVWAAIDALAERYSLSASGLAKKAGLDSTAFNKSKRQSVDGRPRWPSTESLAKIIEATNSSLEEFLAFVEPGRAGSRAKAGGQAAGVPLLGFAQAGAGGFFDDSGFPAGQGWELIVEPGATVRKGDRVVVKTISGEVMAKVLERQGQGVIELLSLNPEHPNRRFPTTEVEWVARIVWASQ
ncbi:S24 family peptidase [Aminobacter sp. MET-1]|uniref:S24 family peptidase n=1 Tax=Aminobacter sp. MET-1 TaxID=2951085 RepID=UPI002269F8BC|nr:helix-turn-helix transcriptional regulator [Aminobacter sp. MET-1]MCX8572463.1 helix-turn-helix transcriptional regulator [Aminobacter sp. MET-1]